MAFRRELLELALPMPPGVAHDFWLGMLEELSGRPMFMPRVLLLYRRHGTSASYAGGRSGRPFGTRLLSRGALAMHLAMRMARGKVSRGT
jgi:hypothetical protein